MAELTHSEQAKKNNISNEPKAEERKHLVEMVENLLDPLRESWSEFCTEHEIGSGAIIVKSGYRSALLNHIVGGTLTSSHTTGYAVDIKPANGLLYDFKMFCLSWLKGRDYDQFISEDEKNGVPSWIHIGYKHTEKGQRKQNLKMINGKYFAI